MRNAKRIHRRSFLAGAAGGVAAGYFTLASAASAQPAAESVTLGVMGVNGRGAALARGFAGLPNVAVAAVCDVDERASSKCASIVSERGAKAPEMVEDFRRMLERSDIDAIVIAAPDHWHAPAGIAACNAKKHVYVEKPCSHNPQEGEWLVAAARKHDRVVSMGTQRRSWPALIEAMRLLQSGKIGRVLNAQAWYNNRRGSIQHGSAAPVPEWLNWDLWQGPAPRQEYRDNIVHYHWHWYWNWGTGELGNNGVHAIDLCRWGLGVDYPSRVVSSGLKLRHDDDQETPDTHVVSFEFKDALITWLGNSWSPRGVEDNSFGARFLGTEGSLATLDNGYVIYDMQNKEVERNTGSGGDEVHLADFVAAIREGRRPNADIEEGHKTTLLCNLGNISHRIGRQLTIDPTNGHIQGDAAAAKLWAREYEEGWKPEV